MDRQMDSWTDTQEQICRHGGIKMFIYGTYYTFRQFRCMKTQNHSVPAGRIPANNFNP